MHYYYHYFMTYFSWMTCMFTQSYMNLLTSFKQKYSISEMALNVWISKHCFLCKVRALSDYHWHPNHVSQFTETNTRLICVDKQLAYSRVCNILHFSLTFKHLKGFRDAAHLSLNAVQLATCDNCLSTWILSSESCLSQARKASWALCRESSNCRCICF